MNEKWRCSRSEQNSENIAVWSREGERFILSLEWILTSIEVDISLRL